MNANTATIVLAFSLLAGCVKEVQEVQEAGPISVRVRSEKDAGTVRGVAWREEVLETFRACASTFDLDGTGRRAAAFVDDWFAAARSVDECDTKNMELVTNFYSRIKNLLGTTYGNARGETCNRTRVDLLVDVDGVANTIASRLSTYESQCRTKAGSIELEKSRKALELRLDDMRSRADAYVNR
jgi:hypothetical protein